MRETITKAAVVGRVGGGLAVALGIGVAIGFGTCAEASAAPADSMGSSSRVVATDHGAQAARRASAVTTGGNGSRRATRSSTPTAASAAGLASAAVRVAAPVLVAAAAAVPVPVTGREARGSTARHPAPVADAASIGFPWCDPRGRQITIYKGTHFAIPNNFGYFIKQTIGTGTFTTNSVYDLTDVDQYDWNKFTGIAFTPLEPDRNSAMVGWRYNLTTQEFEIAPFYNVDKVRILPNENPLSPGYEVISVPAGETFEFTVDYTGITLSYGGTTVVKPYPPGLVANVWTAARVSGWFGGNEVAPRTLSYFIHLN